MKNREKCGVVLCIHHKQEEKEENNSEYFPKEYSTIYKGLDDVIKESIIFSNIDSTRRQNNMPTLGFSEKSNLYF